MTQRLVIFCKLYYNDVGLIWKKAKHYYFVNLELFGGFNTVMEGVQEVLPNQAKLRTPSLAGSATEQCCLYFVTKAFIVLMNCLETAFMLLITLISGPHREHGRVCVCVCLDNDI